MYNEYEPRFIDRSQSREIPKAAHPNARKALVPSYFELQSTTILKHLFDQTMTTLPI
jgi:hypothetical protein